MYPVEIGRDDIIFNTLILNPDAPETIVTVHGMFGNLSQFYLTLAPYLSKKYRIIMYDLKSHGKSTRHTTGYDVLSFAEELRCFLDKLQIEKCHFLGFSFGALVVLKLAMLYKDRVDKVIAIEIPVRPLKPLRKGGSYTFDDFMDFANELPSNVKDNFLRSKRQIKNTFEMYEFIINETTFIDDVNNEKEFGWGEYYSIDAHVQLLYGRKSVCLPELFRINEWIRKREIQVIDGDHGFFMQRPEETATIISTFLEKPVDTPNNHIKEFNLFSETWQE